MPNVPLTGPRGPRDPVDFYQVYIYPQIKTEHPNANLRELNRIIYRMFSQLSLEKQQPFIDLADEDRRDNDRLYYSQGGYGPYRQSLLPGGISGSAVSKRTFTKRLYDKFLGKHLNKKLQRINEKMATGEFLQHVRTKDNKPIPSDIESHIIKYLFGKKRSRRSRRSHNRRNRRNIKR